MPGGSVILKTAAAGTAGSTQNVPRAVETILPSGLIQTNVILTVATLPACNAGLQGAESIVSDATSPAFLVTPTGSGTKLSPVVCTGTAWVAY
jgi:hypothetical protein